MRCSVNASCVGFLTQGSCLGQSMRNARFASASARDRSCPLPSQYSTAPQILFGSYSLDERSGCCPVNHSSCSAYRRRKPSSPTISSCTCALLVKFSTIGMAARDRPLTTEADGVPRSFQLSMGCRLIRLGRPWSFGFCSYNRCGTCF